MNRLLIIFIIFLAPLILTPSTAFSKNPSELQTFQVFFENDLFGDTDKYYTNAVQLTWLSNDLKRYKDDVRLPEWAFPIIQAIPFSGDPDSTHNIGIVLGQQIYTPSDIQVTTRIENDRPYAGYLYGGLALHSKTKTILDTLEITMGVVGPAAKAEFSQNKVHELRDIPTAKGWKNQLHNEPAFGLSWQRKWRLHKYNFFDFLEYDLISHSGLTLGNVRISGFAGGEIRFGHNIPLDFGSDIIHAGAGISAPVIENAIPGWKNFGSHLFLSSQVEAVGRDIFLDGNTFESGPDVDKKNLVADLSAGFALSFNTIKLTYRHLFRTKQFDGQEQGQVIGSLTLTVSF
jgi:lipid A 3-O-deacylase